MRIKKGMYQSKQAGIIPNQELVKHMDPFEYHPVQHTPVLWVHDNLKTIFSLVVDDFFVQYSSVEDADHSKMRSKQKILSHSIWKQKSILESSWISIV